jgi:WD40 repeat protein
VYRLPGVPPTLGGIIWPWPIVRERKTLTGHTAIVRCVAFSRDGKLLASGGGRNNWPVKLWDVASGKEIAELKGHKGPIASLAFGPGGLLATGSFDHDVILWDTDRPADPPLATLKGHTDVVSSLAFSPDGKTLASASIFRDQSLRLWDVDRREERARLKGHTAGILAVAFAPDGQTVATGGGDAVIRLWDPTSGRERMVLPGHAAQIMSLAFSPDNRVLASAGADRLVRLWDVEDNREETHQAPATGRLGPLQLSRNAGRLVFADNALRVWEPAKNRAQPLDSQPLLIRLLATGPDGAVAAMDDHGSLRVWRRGQQVKLLPGFTNVRCLAVSRDAQFAAVGMANGEIDLINVLSGAKSTVVAAHSSPVTVLEFSPDGRQLASGGGDRAAKLWDVDGLKLKQTFAEHPFELRVLAFSPTLPTLAAGCVDGTLKLWHRETGAELAVMVGHTDAVTALAFSPDGQALASGSRDRSVKIWDAQTGQERTTLAGHTDPVVDVAFAPDGLLLASVTNDGALKLWRADRR